MPISLRRDSPVTQLLRHDKLTVSYSVVMAGAGYGAEDAG